MVKLAYAFHQLNQTSFHLPDFHQAIPIENLTLTMRIAPKMAMLFTNDCQSLVKGAVQGPEVSGPIGVT